MFGSNNGKRRKQIEFYKKTQDNANAQVSQRREPSPEWHYKLPAYGLPALVIIVFILLGQGFCMTLHNIGHRDSPTGLFHGYGLGWIYFGLVIIGYPIASAIFLRKFKAIWFNNNAMYIDDDIEEYTNDTYLRTIDHLSNELNVAPDTGLGYDGHCSTLMSHIMLSNKGIKKIDMPVFDPEVDGFVKTDEDGNIVTERVHMFNKEFGDMLYDMSNVPQKSRVWYDATNYTFNPIIPRREGGNGKKRAGVYGRLPYDKLSDCINKEFYPLPTETERPAGVYFYDDRPVNTILISITRGGKGQTYIEPACDLWMRERDMWNLFTTDPKGELLAKFYYAATKRGMEVVQFNLMNPNLTNIFNPLANAIQEFRRNNINKGASLIDSIVDTLFPDNGEIWNPAAGNMFRRAVYLLFDYYIEQEKYLRHMAYRDNIPQEVLEQEIDKLYSKVTMYNVYVLIGELAAKVSKDPKFINIVPDAPNEPQKDLLTLLFDAMSLLPMNSLRSLATTANNNIKQINGAQQTIAGIYATLLTGLSAYDDPTTIALMSGSLSETFDVTGLGFPRRFGIQFDAEYVKKFHIDGEIGKWTAYRDKDFTDQYVSLNDKGKDTGDFRHEERVKVSNWIWGHFKGKFDGEEAYLKLSIEASDGTIIHEFFFKFIKGYKTFEGISYLINPVTHAKIVSNGVLIELDPITKEPKVSEFSTPQIEYVTKSYREVSRPIIASTQAFYSEKPKYIAAVTPPDKQHYQKHILIIIKQLIDEIYSNSYVTKANRKPIIGTRFLFEEFGNIRSGDKGIPNIDTITSIALGQNVQLTFVLQSFQQLRAVYGEDVEKIIRANSSNIIFLKSNDEELINDLVRLSGTKHEIRGQNKSVPRKVGDLITVSEPIINYTSGQVETTTLQSNDLLFLAGKVPGNAVTFSSGEMPILNKLDKIMPMAAGLHRHLPQPTTGQYSDNTMPRTLGINGVNFLNNTINGEELVRARVAQAKIAIDVKAEVLEIANNNNVYINEMDGELADIMMNIVYDKYESENGIERPILSKPTPLYETASEMMDLMLAIKDLSIPKEHRKIKAADLRSILVRCVMNPELDKWTAMYRDYPSETALGYDAAKVSAFITKFKKAHPAPRKLKVDVVDIYKAAKDIPDYVEYDDGSDILFDLLNTHHTDAFEELMECFIDGSTKPPQGVSINKVDNGDSTDYTCTVDGVFVATYTALSDNNYSIKYSQDVGAVAKAVAKNAGLLQLIQSVLNDK